MLLPLRPGLWRYYLGSLQSNRGSGSSNFSQLVIVSRDSSWRRGELGLSLNTMVSQLECGPVHSWLCGGMNFRLYISVTQILLTGRKSGEGILFWMTFSLISMFEV